MRIGTWDKTATVAAAAALGVLAVLPDDSSTRSLDSEAVRRAGQVALELGDSGTPFTWDDAATGVSGSVMPLRVFRSADGQWCRRYVVTIEDGGHPTVQSHTACRQLDGHWRTVRDPQATQVAEMDG